MAELNLPESTMFTFKMCHLTQESTALHVRFTCQLFSLACIFSLFQTRCGWLFFFTLICAGLQRGKLFSCSFLGFEKNSVPEWHRFVFSPPELLHCQIHQHQRLCREAEHGAAHPQVFLQFLDCLLWWGCIPGRGVREHSFSFSPNES